MARMVVVRTELESIPVEQALALAREPEAVTDAAPDGRALAIGEQAAVGLGRERTRRALEAASRRRGDSAERRGLPAAPAPAAGVAASRTRRPGPR